MAGNNAQPLLLSADEGARLVGVGRSLWWSMHSSVRLGPLPIKLGRRTLWRRDELTQWVEAGCPARVKWLAISEAG